MLKLDDFVQAKLYPNKEDVIQDALRYLLRGRPELRIQLAIYQYQTEPISLAKAAQLAGVSWMQMGQILRDHGVAPRLGAETLQEAQDEVQALRDFFEEQA
jgi:predicted HTH domain antitoxin